MNRYRSKRNVMLILDIIAIEISFVVSITIRYSLLIKNLGSTLVKTTYFTYFAYALLLYIITFLIKGKPRLDRQSYREIIIQTIEHQLIFIAGYIVFFFIFKQEFTISRVVVCLFFSGNVVLTSLFRILYHNYCVKKNEEIASREEMIKKNEEIEDLEGLNYNDTRHCYIVGSKSIGQYGGYETFVMNLLQHHKDNKDIKYHVACKANGSGYMNLDKLPGAMRINDEEFAYCNAHCFLVKVPEKIGAAQAIYYDIRALKWACSHIEKNHISRPIVYILASRIGPFERKYVQRIHDAGGLVYQNPDGHEDWRRKWSFLIRKYWKLSERYAVKNADLVVCDSKAIETYIKEEYAAYKPKTTFIAYGTHLNPSILKDDDPKFQNWKAQHNLSNSYYCCIGRFVEENNYEIMIREFMASKTKKDFAIITTENPKYARQLQEKLNYKKDKRIKFVGTVYDPELLKKIREDAFAYFHGHEVGGTNPSLLESMGSTKLNLLYDVEFNREVAEDAAFYWNKEEGNLSRLIDKIDKICTKERNKYGELSKKRIREEYNWEYICLKYEKIIRKQCDI